MRMMKEKMIAVKTSTQQFLKNTYPLHYSRNYTV